MQTQEIDEVIEILTSPEVKAHFAVLPPEDQLAYASRIKWLSIAHAHQVPESWDWSIALVLGGRGAGKTRLAAEWLWWQAWSKPKTRWLVGAPTHSDLKDVCFMGDSGLVNVIPQILIKKHLKDDNEITLINGSIIKGIPASEPERFRGPQFHGGWLDELAAWDYLQEAWDLLSFSIRLGNKTQLMCTTTPKPKDLIVELVGRNGQDVSLTTASTYANIDNLSANFKKQIEQYDPDSALYRQEVLAEILDPELTGIVKRKWFKLWPAFNSQGDVMPLPKLEFICMSLDCAYTDKSQNDPTACLVFGVFKPLDAPMSVLILDAWQDHLQYPDLKPRVMDEFEVVYGEGKDKKRIEMILVEDKSAGISLIQDLQRAQLPVESYNPGKADKVQRLSIVANIIRAGRVWVPESSVNKGYVRDWAEGAISQICAFPDATHDDYVDALTQALRWLRDAGFLNIDPPPRDDYDPEDLIDANPVQRGNPYAQ